VKVLVVTESYWPNLDGGSVFERNLVHGLGERGHDVHVIAPSPTGAPFLEQDKDSTIHRLRSIRLPGKFGRVGARTSVWPKRKIHRVFTEFEPDVVHYHNLFGIGLISLRYARQHGIPVVATNHNMPENMIDNVGPLGRVLSMDRVWQWQIKRLNQANFVTSPTQTAVDMLLAHGLSVPNRAISNGVDLEQYTPGPKDQALLRKLGLPKNKPIVLYVGRLDGEKRMDVWLDAAAKIVTEMDAHFLIGGRGAAVPGLKRQAAGLGISNRVTFAGPIDHDELTPFYRLGDVFAIASPAELQSLVTLEAMAAGLPIVVCDAAALPELCKSGRNGYLFLAGDPVGMAKSVGRILSNPTMGRKMGAESRKIVEEFHDVREMPKNYEAVYREVTA